MRPPRNDRECFYEGFVESGNVRSETGASKVVTGPLIDNLQGGYQDLRIFQVLFGAAQYFKHETSINRPKECEMKSGEGEKRQ
jgi:hypothetical protein